MMSLELDHIFCFCDPLLPEVEILESEGFILTSGRKHEGQGTANRSIMFESNYLELIFIESKKDAQLNKLNLSLRANWKTTGSNPFGIALRGEIPEKDLKNFWEYSPPYAPDLKIRVHNFNELHPNFPLLFVMPTLGTDSRTPLKASPIHRTGTTKILKVRIGTPFPIWPLSNIISGIEIEKSLKHCLQVDVNGYDSKTLHLNELLSLNFVEIT